MIGKPDCAGPCNYCNVHCWQAKAKTQLKQAKHLELTMSNLDRRNFLKLSACSLVGITMGGVSLQALAEEQIKLDDPLAVAMKYVHKSTVEGSSCSNCAHIKGDATAEWRPCNIFPAKLVNNNGWCAAWMKMPG
jgi:hypothetical protein